jgi:hypothetical protein
MVRIINPMKRIFVEILGRETEPVDIEISPGDTAGAILSHLQLAEYVLATFSMFNADWRDKGRYPRAYARGTG